MVDAKGSTAAASPAFDPSADFSALYIDDEDWRGITEPGATTFRLSTGGFGVKRRSNTRLGKTVRFDPCALLHSAALEGDLETVKVASPKALGQNLSGDVALTALKNAVISHHCDVVKFLINFGCDVNMADNDGWSPLHFAAAVNDVEMARALVECGACVLAKTAVDHETPEQKCSRNGPGYDECIQYLRDTAAKLGVVNDGIVYATCSYCASSADELSFSRGDRLKIIRKGDGKESEWWWANFSGTEGYVPQNLISIYQPVCPTHLQTISK
jgi:hypothetical protein